MHLFVGKWCRNWMFEKHNYIDMTVVFVMKLTEQMEIIRNNSQQQDMKSLCEENQ